MIFELWNCRLKIMLEKLKKSIEPTVTLVQIPADPTPIVTRSAPEPVKIEEPKPPLNMKELSRRFTDRAGEYYEKALNTTALELMHAQAIHLKQLELQIEKEKRTRLVSGAG